MPQGSEAAMTSADLPTIGAVSASGANRRREDSVRSLEKAIAIIDWFSTLDRYLSVACIAKQLGIRFVGVPIRNLSGRVFTALSISGPARKVTEFRVAELGELVIHYADAISAQLGYRADALRIS